MKVKDVVVYVFAQCLGAVVAAMVLCGVVVGNLSYSLAVDGLCQNGYDQASPGEILGDLRIHSGSDADIRLLACDPSTDRVKTEIGLVER
jgi:hypothetical protein